jgi:cysteine synthase
MGSPFEGRVSNSPSLLLSQIPSFRDEVEEVTDEDVIETTKELGSGHGLLVGISSGANVWAAR